MVYEGEEVKLEDNYLLGDFKITNLTKRKKGETTIELLFELTDNSFSVALAVTVPPSIIVVA